jgi:hypothetical protein
MTFLGGVRRELMQRLFDVLHGNWGYICDALLKGNANVVACLPAPRAWPCGVFPFVLLFAWCFSLPFLQKNDYETTSSFLLIGGFRNNRNKPLPFLVKPVDKNIFLFCNLIGTFQANVPDNGTG